MDATFWKAQYYGCNIMDATFWKAQYYGCNIMDATFWKAQYHGCNILKSTISWMQHHGCNILKSTILWMQHYGCNIMDATFWMQHLNATFWMQIIECNNLNALTYIQLSGYWQCVLCPWQHNAKWALSILFIAMWREMGNFQWAPGDMKLTGRYALRSCQYKVK